MRQVRSQGRNRKRVVVMNGLKAQLYLAQGNTLGNDDTPSLAPCKGSYTNLKREVIKNNMGINKRVCSCPYRAHIKCGDTHPQGAVLPLTLQDSALG